MQPGALGVGGGPVSELERKEGWMDGGWIGKERERRTRPLTPLPSPPLSLSPALDGDAEFYVQELVGMAVSLAGGAAAGAASGLESAPRAPLGTVVDVYSGTGPFDTLRIALSPAGLVSARAAAAGEGGAVIDEGGDEAGEGGDSGAPGDAAAASAPSIPATPAGDAPTLLLPFADEFVREVCRTTRTMAVAPPPGLLGLAVGSVDAAARKEAKKASRRRRPARGKKGVEADGASPPLPAPHDPAWEGRRGADAPGA